MWQSLQNSAIKIVLSMIFIGSSVIASNAQELNCDVTVNTDQVQGTNNSVFQTLQEAIR